LRLKLPGRPKMNICRQVRIKPTQPNQAWSMDLVADQLANGAKLRTLTIIDVFSKEALAIDGEAAAAYKRLNCLMRSITSQSLRNIVHNQFRMMTSAAQKKTARSG